MQPISVSSILQLPIMPKLQPQHIMPLHIMQQLIMPPWAIMHRFFIISAAVRSSQVHNIFIPPGVRCISILQRGAIIMPAIIGDIMPGIPVPIIGMPIIGMFIIGFIAEGIIPAIRSDIMFVIVLIIGTPLVE